MLLVYEQWNWDGTGPTQVGTLRDGVINAIHSDIRNAPSSSHNTSVMAVGTIKRTFPIFTDRIRVRVDYYQSYLVR